MEILPGLNVYNSLFLNYSGELNGLIDLVWIGCGIIGTPQQVLIIQ